MGKMKSGFASVCIALLTVISGLSIIDMGSDYQTVGIQSADPPHNITHFLHTGSTAKYFSPGVSVLNYFDTNLPLNTTGSGMSYTGYEQFALQWYMFPATASELSVTKIDAIIWICGEVGTGQPNMAGKIEAYEVTEQNINDLNVTGTMIGYNNIPSNTPLFSYPPSTPMIFSITFSHAFAANSTIRLVLTINPGTSGAGVGTQYTNVTVFWDSYHLFDSRLLLHTENPLTIDSCETRDKTGAAKDDFLDQGNTTMYFSANVSDPYGGYDIKWVNLTVRDPSGTPIAGLDDVPMVRVSGNNRSPVCTYEVSWNYTGMPVGRYPFEIWAVDNSGRTLYSYFAQFTYSPYDETLLGEMVIGIMYNLYVHLNDTLNISLSGAEVRYGSISEFSNDTGFASLKVFGNGTMEVHWHGVMVHHSAVNITSDMVIYVTCDVYYPEIFVLDVMSNPLPSAAVFFAYPDGDELPVLMSSANGSVGVIDQVPAGNSSLSVWWRGSQVYNGTIEVSANGPLNVNCEVFYLTVAVVDPEGYPLLMANVVVLDAETHILLDSRMVNDTGISVSRLPKGMYDIEVYWHGNPVGTEGDIMLYANNATIIEAFVYGVDLFAVDDRGVALQNAHFIVRSISEVVISDLTDEAGLVHAVLPAGSLAVEVYWYGDLVNQTSISLTSDSDITFSCDVIYVTVRPVDSRGAVLEGATVMIGEGDRIVGTVTCGEDNATFRIPAGDWNIKVVWSSETVASVDATIKSTASMQIVCSVSYLKVDSEDSAGNLLDDVAITVRDLSGEVIAYGVATGGSVEFRLVNQHVSVEGTYSGDHLMTHIEVSEDAQLNLSADIGVTLIFDAYPPSFFVTNLFAMLAACIIAVMAAFAVMYVLMGRRKPGSDIPPPPSDETSAKKENGAVKEKNKVGSNESDSIKGSGKTVRKVKGGETR